MSIPFNQELATGLSRFNTHLRADKGAGDQLRKDPTSTVKQYLTGIGVEIPDPETFHVHIIGPGNPLPDEPERATIERYVYVFRADGMFEFRVVPGDPNGNDDIMVHPTGACCCCNCCAIELAA